MHLNKIELKEYWRMSSIEKIINRISTRRKENYSKKEKNMWSYTTISPNPRENKRVTVRDVRSVECDGVRVECYNVVDMYI